MKVAARRLLEEQITVVIVLESGKKDDSRGRMRRKVLRESGR